MAVRNDDRVWGTPVLDVPAAPPTAEHSPAAAPPQATRRLPSAEATLLGVAGPPPAATRPTRPDCPTACRPLARVSQPQVEEFSTLEASMPALMLLIAAVAAVFLGMLMVV
jgi:hypothetical protein